MNEIDRSIEVILTSSDEDQSATNITTHVALSAKWSTRTYMVHHKTNEQLLDWAKKLVCPSPNNPLIDILSGQLTSQQHPFLLRDGFYVLSIAIDDKCKWTIRKMRQPTT